MIKIKTNKVAGGGILSAFSIAMLFCAEYAPLTLIFLFATSIIGGICILRYRTPCALISYVVTSLISIFFVPDVALMYIVLFGIYPIVKLYIEKIRKIFIEYIIKFIYWNLALTAIYIVIKAVGHIYLWDFGIWLLWLIGIILLAFYDLIFSVVINAFYKTYYKYLK